MKFVLHFFMFAFLCSCAAMGPTGSVSETVKAEGLRYKIASKPKIINAKKNDVSFETQLFFQQAEYKLAAEYASYGIELNNKEFYVIKPLPIGGAIGRISGVLKFVNNSDRIIRTKQHLINIKLNGRELRIKSVFSHGTSKEFEILPNDWVALLFVTTDVVDFTALPKTSKLSISVINFPTQTDLAGNVSRVSNFNSDHYFSISSAKETETLEYRKMHLTANEAYNIESQIAYRKINTDNSIEYEKRSVLSEFQEIINQYPILGLDRERADFKINDLFFPIDNRLIGPHLWKVVQNSK